MKGLRFCPPDKTVQGRSTVGRRTGKTAGGRPTARTTSRRPFLLQKRCATCLDGQWRRCDGLPVTGTNIGAHFPLTEAILTTGRQTMGDKKIHRPGGPDFSITTWDVRGFPGNPKFRPMTVDLGPIQSLSRSCPGTYGCSRIKT